jgi:aminoglycoside phosphotransferase (APT) family kinase protein
MKVEKVEDKKLEQVVKTIAPRSKLLRAWPLEGGASAQMTALAIGLPDGQTKKVIVRRPGAGSLEQNPRTAADEFKLLQILQAAGLAAPVPLYLDQSGQVFATPYLVIEYIEGKVAFTPANLADFIPQLATSLARIHGLDGSQHDLSFLPEQATKLAFNRPAAGDNSSSDEGRIRQTLAAMGPWTRANPAVLLHGDFWPGNVLWRDGCLAAVIDWEDAALGDPLADLAISRLDILLLFGRQAMNDFTHHYQALTAVDGANLPYWDLHAALRAAPHLAAWAAGYPQLGRPDITDQTMQEGHTWFTTQALAKLE